jgi:hypothetical protein
VLQDFGEIYDATATAQTHHMTIYKVPGTAPSLVFSAGTIHWSWGLDDQHDNTAGSSMAADPNIQQATLNVLADMGVQPSSLNGLSSASASTDMTAPASSLTAATFTALSTARVGVPISIDVTATDAGGQVGGVEVSTDSGTLWHPATPGSSVWTYTWKPSVAGTTTVKTRAVDDSGNIETPGTGASVTVSADNMFLFTVGKVEFSGGSADWDEFTASADSPEYIEGSGSAANVRQWIGHSLCGGCGTTSKTQRLTFNNLVAGQSYTFTVFPAYVTDAGDALATYLAQIVAGSGTVTAGGAKTYSTQGFQDADGAWRISFVPSTTSVTLQLGNNASSATHYMYFDAILSTIGVIEASPATIPTGSTCSYEFHAPPYLTGDEFAYPTFKAGVDGLAKVRDWIGRSTYQTCGGSQKMQRLSFNGLSPSTTYAITIYPSVAATAGYDFKARLIGGSATLNSGATKHFSATSYLTAHDADGQWRILFTTGTDGAATIELYNDAPVGTTDYIYIDAIGLEKNAS